MTKKEENFDKILELLCQGYNNAEIAKKLNYSVANVKSCIMQYRAKYRAKNATHLACIYLAEKLTNF